MKVREIRFECNQCARHKPCRAQVVTDMLQYQQTRCLTDGGPDCDWKRLPDGPEYEVPDTGWRDKGG